jgi:Pentapeptide repeats (8 copies)
VGALTDERKHPNFRGNEEDLREFLKLANSPIRNERRSEALHQWEQYKLRRQYTEVPYGGKKGAHMRSLVAHVIDLRGANLDGITLGYADLRGAILDNCSLRGAWFKGVNLENARLKNADLTARPDDGRGAARLLHADLRRTDFTAANLTGVDLSFARLNGAILSGANLTDATLVSAMLIETNVDGARFLRTQVYGISAWDLKGTAAEQHDLVVTPESQPPITVDNLKVAQFIYLLINNPEIRHVIDTITSKVVLILGRLGPPAIRVHGHKSTHSRD